jgi:hypothetical protein
MAYVPFPPRIPSDLRLLPFRGTLAVASGLLTSSALRGPAWRRLFPDIYLSADIQLDHQLWCDAALLYAARGVVSGLSATYVMGVDLLPSADALVELTAPHPAKSRAAGLRVVNAPLPTSHLAAFGQHWMTSPERTALDLARGLDRVNAIAAVDALLNKKLTSIDAIRDLTMITPWLRGRQKVPSVLLRLV